MGFYETTGASKTVFQWHPGGAGPSKNVSALPENIFYCWR